MLTTSILLALTLLAPAASHAPVVHATAIAPAVESVDELVTKGRALLAQGKAAEAEAVFLEAERLDQSTIKTRMWTLRSWLPQGRVNDALDAIDKLDRAGQKGSEMDYLYGMAWAYKAKGYLKEPAPGNIIALAFGDATAFLEKATKADPARYSDAFMPLAESAWYARDLVLARSAATKACEISPADAEAFLILGQVAMAQFVSSNGDEAQRVAADAHWEAARAANAKAAELLAALGTPAAKARAATAHLELARAFGWKKQADDVAREFGLALGLNPAVVDFDEVRGALDGPRFLAALETGAKNYADNWGAEDKGDALLLFWLGSMELDQKQYEKAESAYLRSVTKWPAYTEAWFYVALARYSQQKYAEAIEALRRNFTDDPAGLVASIGRNRDYNIAILDGLVGWSARKKNNLDAAFITGIETAVAPGWAPYWSNLGLFYRDAGDVLARNKKADEKDKKTAMELWEKSLAAYEKALALAPDDPNVLCDLAVVLHYNLDRDLPRAKSLYEKSLARATELLKRTDLSAGDRDRYETAKKDSADNLAKMARELERKQKDTPK